MLRPRVARAACIPLAVLWALLAPVKVRAATPASSSVSLQGWTTDGRAFAYQAILVANAHLAAQVMRELQALPAPH